MKSSFALDKLLDHYEIYIWLLIEQIKRFFHKGVAFTFGNQLICFSYWVDSYSCGVLA